MDCKDPNPSDVSALLFTPEESVHLKIISIHKRGRKEDFLFLSIAGQGSMSKELNNQSSTGCFLWTQRT